VNRLDKAIEDFEDETLDLDLAERISNLRDALTWAAFDRLKTIQKFGLKSAESEELEFKQIECMKQYKIIDQLHRSQLQQNKALGKAQNDGMDSKDMLRKIKDMKSSMGEIVVSVPKD